ncbi:phosphoribosylglycinamide formyltransferase [Solidesulfovibrio fructosivorans JJ]]|uniref:Phosphoribosylglycinamide formyltransferase n=1 Tax=Solidesulfovibrio fructosivorans JJ] TaxID=596151 RepID=E1JY78_SOLFR|nr:phosphoribosylglycinamide formyltransferase [Solidesulfovibrio fructosivorans]EFL50652.1 phosphoribosylglycinamide formyltransferase [Solidesulfovibrio fructosivorans JJ]]
MSLPLAVLVSGSGSNLQAIIDRIEAGRIDARIKVVLSDKADAHGLVRAAKHGIPTRVLPFGEYPDRAAFDAALLAAVRESGARAVILAGFMRLLGKGFIAAYRDRILNIHPALLPSFPGLRAQEQAIGYGVAVSGATVHFVDEKMDNGPIVIQAAVPALPDDDAKSLGARILALEHRIYPQAVAWLAAGRLAIDGRKTRLAPSGAPLAHMDSPCLVNPPLEEGF